MKKHFNIYYCNECDKNFLIECKSGIYKDIRCPVCFTGDVEELSNIKSINI